MLRRCVVLFLLLFMAAAQSALAAQNNVLVIVADDLGLQLGCYGDRQTRTPNLDRLAEGATRFTQAYCTTSSCSACRSVILSGRYNHATAHYGHEHGYNHFRTYEWMKTLPVALAEAGYRTCSAGKFHVAPEPVYHFERYYNKVDGHNPVALAAEARKFLAEKDERPFFLYFCPFDPHRAAGAGGFANEKPHPGVTPVAFDPEKTTPPAWLPDRPEVRREWAQFLEAINRLDQGIGALLTALADTGHADDTLVMVLSDNGPPFPGAKTTLYQPGMNLPLIVRRPGQASPVVTDARVTFADLVPTILEFTGVSPEKMMAIDPTKPKKSKKRDLGLQGRSFLGILDQSHPDGWDEIYASHTFHEITTYYPMRAIISGRYKYIFNVAHQLPYPFASDLYDSPTWQGVLKRGDRLYGERSVQAYIQRPRHELYDLESDPGELKNLAADPQHAETLKKLQAKVRDWQTRTDDPWVSKWVYE
ncbi:MAG TPA: sulfatase [Pirellulales bacterium]|jgi:N-sulfoglucosamine sulfohydrolase|nr:sulfatase [Pirellulales bacterium]